MEISAANAGAHSVPLTYTDGSKGTATLETGKHGGTVLVLRKGYPVAAETVAGIKVEHVTDTVLAALGVAEDDIPDVWSTAGRIADMEA